MGADALNCTSNLAACPASITVLGEIDRDGRVGRPMVSVKSTTVPFNASVRVPRLVTIVKTPLLGPAAVAVNETAIVQVELLASVPQLLVCVYAPLTLTLVTFKVVPDRLKNVRFCGADCVPTTLLKVSAPGSSNNGS
jgi:hypothetical protein